MLVEFDKHSPVSLSTLSGEHDSPRLFSSHTIPTLSEKTGEPSLLLGLFLLLKSLQREAQNTNLKTENSRGVTIVK